LQQSRCAHGKRCIERNQLPCSFDRFTDGNCRFTEKPGWVRDHPREEESWRTINTAQEREWSFFVSRDTITFGGGRQPAREVPGLGLPEKVLRKIFNENPKRLFPGIAKK
jgi:hypothetical protein